MVYGNRDPTSELIACYLPRRLHWRWRIIEKKCESVVCDSSRHFSALQLIHCRYGFVTFETQEDAEKIIKKEVSVNCSRKKHIADHITLSRLKKIYSMFFL